MKRGNLVLSLLLISILFISGCTEFSRQSQDPRDNAVQRIVERISLEIDRIQGNAPSSFELIKKGISCKGWERFGPHEFKGEDCFVEKPKGIVGANLGSNCVCCNSCNVNGQDECMNCETCDCEESGGGGTPWYIKMANCIRYGHHQGETWICDHYADAEALSVYDVLDPVLYTGTNVDANFPEEDPLRTEPAAKVEILEVDTINKKIKVYMTSNTNVAGIQFNVEGLELEDVSGGSVEENDFIISSKAGNPMVLAFSISGQVIPADCIECGSSELTINKETQLILEIEYSSIGSEVCFDNNNARIISDTTGSQIPTEWGNCFHTTYSGCTDEDGCNYQNTATTSTSCIYPENYPDNQYDCDGECTQEVDCAGVCGGTKVLDECGFCGYYLDSCHSSCEDCAGVCDGDTEVDCAGQCGGNSEQDCFGICAGSAEIDDCGVCNGDGVNTNQHGSCVCEVEGDVWADCSGQCGGGLEIDCTGTCGGNSQSDCTGECGGFGEFDCAGVCNGDAEWGGPGCELSGNNWYEVCHSECGWSSTWGNWPNNCHEHQGWPVSYSTYPEGTQDSEVYDCDWNGDQEDGYPHCPDGSAPYPGGQLYDHHGEQTPFTFEHDCNQDELNEGNCEEFCQSKGLNCQDNCQWGNYINWWYMMGDVDQSGGGWKYYGGNSPDSCNHDMSYWYEATNYYDLCQFEVQYPLGCNTDFDDWGDDYCYGPFDCGIRCCCG